MLGAAEGAAPVCSAVGGDSGAVGAAVVAPFSHISGRGWSRPCHTCCGRETRFDSGQAPLPTATLAWGAVGGSSWAAGAAVVAPLGSDVAALGPAISVPALLARPERAESAAEAAPAALAGAPPVLGADLGAAPALGAVGSDSGAAGAAVATPWPATAAQALLAPLERAECAAAVAAPAALAGAFFRGAQF